MKRTPAPDFSLHLQFVTTRTNRKLPLFGRQELCAEFLAALREVREKHSFELFAYVVMPDHVHLLVRPQDGRISALMRKIKSLSARRMIERLKRPGPDRLLVSLRRSPPGRRRHTYEVWQDGFHAVPLWSNWMVRKKIDYIHPNPLRKGLVKSAKEYPWSSFNGYYGIERTGIPLDRVPT